MQCMDSTMQKAVWARVMATGDEAQNCPTPPPQCPACITAQELLALMQDEKNDCATYRYLSCKSCGAEAKALKELSQEEACHFKKLHALYYILTGQCVCLDPAKPACTACLAVSLRERYEAELAGARAYEEAAAKWPDMAAEFRCLAEDERAHSRKLVCLLQYRL